MPEIRRASTGPERLLKGSSLTAPTLGTRMLRPDAGCAPAGGGDAGHGDGDDGFTRAPIAPKASGEMPSNELAGMLAAISVP